MLITHFYSHFLPPRRNLPNHFEALRNRTNHKMKLNEIAVARSSQGAHSFYLPDDNSSLKTTKGYIITPNQGQD